MEVIGYFQIIKDVAVSGAACLTAYVAFTGVSKWQDEMSGKANFEVARELARSMYLLRDEISYCRSPFTAAHEFPDTYRSGLGNHTNEEHGQAWAYVYSNRWEPVGKALQLFDTASLEAEALWGRDIKDKTNALRKCVRSLQVDIQAYISNKYNGGESFEDREYAKKVEFGIWDVKKDENKLTTSINTAISEIESIVRPHLARNINL
ncbi:hypothetical protein Q9F31_000350 [Vibrio alginolyticus]|uniref:hypothetical protein n=1 Tax=Vibrio alginolyticus TaxID=663 RepID=UPI0023D89B04|nr:hypothetical protein [Vibrio alginolyticus]ELA7385315.1 hypothetical protein [Vibrio alginolyticus]WEK79846.1 hypothetical protein PY250_06275 [Vibrio alginolyticus]